VRYQETLKRSLGEEFDLVDIAGVTLLGLRQERVIDPPPNYPPLAELNG
jgi:hypothetical protein